MTDSARPSDSAGSGSRPGGLAGLTPSGRAIVPIAWSLYDFANTIFSYAVVSYAMGLWLTQDTPLGESLGPFAFSLSIAISVGVNAIVSPILGALSDRAGGRRLPYLLFFTLLCILPTAVIGFSPALIGLALFTVANFAYQSALIYYDSTLRTVSYPETRGKLSGIGVAVGYCGTIFIGILIFLLDVPIATVFLLAAVLYGLFAVPLFLAVREPQPPPGTPRPGVRDALAAMGQLRATIADARAVPGLGRFLVGRFFYSDAVNTIIVVMSLVATAAMGLTNTMANLILLALAIVAVVASFGWGRLVDRLGPKRTLMIVLGSWAVGLVVGGVSLGLPGAVGLVLFLAAGAVLGSGLGGVQVSDRVLMMRLSPPEKLGEFFGLYGLVGKGSQVIGQLLFGGILLLFQPILGVGAYQLAVLSLLVTMVIGAWLVWPVSDRWAGSGEIGHDVLPERLAPGVAPLEPR
ncbi:MAG TPA: MFS transporter [Candidatus Limnocylindrales bacterium]|nr:MFS transporter [Candidatus Limnocylindrales bacterium]